MRTSINKTLGAALLGILLAGCASRHAALQEYEAALETGPHKSNGRTVVFFLVDGLPYARMKEALDAGQLPALKEYFSAKGSELLRGASIFPSLTFPNISSYLTASPVDEHGVTGNKVILNGEIVNFESPMSVDALNGLVGSRSIFTRLKAQGRLSASFDAYYRSGSAAHLHRDLESGLAYVNKDYETIDAKAINSFETLLDGTDPKNWPDFVFIHLLGVDSLSHFVGPNAPETRAYLGRLDELLRPLLARLLAGEAQGREVVSLLTADHGMTETSLYFDLEHRLRTLAPGAKLVKEARIAGLYLPGNWNKAQLDALAAKLTGLSGVELAAYRLDDRIHLKSAQLDAEIHYAATSACGRDEFALALRLSRWEGRAVASQSVDDFRCAFSYDGLTDYFYSPFFVSNMAHYFHAKKHPDMLVLAGPKVSFNSDHPAQHGGVQPEEIFVPILIRNARVKASFRGRPLRPYELLNFLLF